MTTESTASSVKISQIVTDISGLNLLENAELVKELKIRLNIQDIAMPAFAAPAASASAEVCPASIFHTPQHTGRSGKGGCGGKDLVHDKVGKV